jgi:RNA polymerase primary sigma factor
MSYKFLPEHVRDAVNTLPERERDIITMRFGLDGNEALTLEEVGLYFNVTRERIRQIEAKALRRLRTMFLYGVDEEGKINET